MCGIERTQELSLRHHSREPLLDFTTANHEKARDRRNAIPNGRGPRLVDVQLDNAGTVAEFRGDLVDDQ